MKIVIVTAHISNGGSERVMTILANGLAEIGHEVFFLIAKKEKNGYALHPKVSITYLPAIASSSRIKCAIHKIKSIRHYMKLIKPDVSIEFLWDGMTSGLFCVGMPLQHIATVRNNLFQSYKEDKVRRKTSNILQYFWFSLAGAIVLQSAGQAIYLRKKWNDKITVISNPLSDSVSHAPLAEICPSCRRLLMVGRLTHEKDYPLILQAMKEIRRRYPDVSLDIFGQGPQQEKLSFMIQDFDLSDSVFLKGFCTDIVQEYLNHDLFLLTSTSEGMPNALIEAMAMGLPCISTDCQTGPSDLILDGVNGFLVPVGDKDALTEKILYVLEMGQKERAEIGSKASSFIRKQCNSQEIVKRWEQLLLKVKDKKSG